MFISPSSKQIPTQYYNKTSVISLIFNLNLKFKKSAIDFSKTNSFLAY